MEKFYVFEPETFDSSIDENAELACDGAEVKADNAQSAAMAYATTLRRRGQWTGDRTLFVWDGKQGKLVSVRVSVSAIVMTEF